MTVPSLTPITPETEVLRLAALSHDATSPERRLRREVFGAEPTMVAELRHDALVEAYSRLANVPLAEAKRQVAELAGELVKARLAALQRFQDLPGAGAPTSREFIGRAMSDTKIQYYCQISGLDITEILRDLQGIYLTFRNDEGRLPRLSGETP